VKKMQELLTSIQNPLVRQVASLKDKKGRDGTGLFMVEGIRFVEEAFEAGAEVCLIMYSPKLGESERGEELLELAARRKVSLHPVSDKVLAHVVDTQTPQGIIAAVRIPKVSLTDLPMQQALIVIVDGVQDPGNLGTIVRTALAAGASGVVTTKGTVDLFNPKTLRSTMGGVFALPVVQGLDIQDLIEWLEGNAIPMAVADAKGEAVYYTTSLLPPIALVIGNEGSGPSAELLGKADLKVSIPLSGGVESLNAAVAAALLLFESSRQRAVNKADSL
jgi:RNA methyltransferase, TrmH family